MNNCGCNYSLIQRIRDCTLGEGQMFPGPFGSRRLTYADFTASGKSISFIEDYIMNNVLPLYGNTHSEATMTARQTGSLYSEARQIIHSAVHGAEHDVVLFCGSGMTAAMDKLIGLLELRIPHDLDTKWTLSKNIPKEQRPVVFIGPFEHHSNELAWRETICEVVTIPESNGVIDLNILDCKLKEYSKRPLKIGSFSAASNVTGITLNTEQISTILHENGAIAVWDYAAAAPHLSMDMHPERLNGIPMSYKDAIVFSPHKLPGGPSTPGVLIVNKHILHNTVPVVPGGGTVTYVNEKEHVYYDDIVLREEGGTQAVIGAIRAGLAIRLKEAVGEKCMETLETKYLKAAIDSWSKNPSIMMLGNYDVPRLSIISIVIKPRNHPSGRYLHHNFVVAVLNDLFGIQTRGGCDCAAPYGHRLLHIDIEHSRDIEKQVMHGLYGIKPGWVRVSFSYLMSQTTVDYIIDAVNLVADWGFLLLPDYHFDVSTGKWQHKNEPKLPFSLLNVDYTHDFATKYDNILGTSDENILVQHMKEARRLLSEIQDEKHQDFTDAHGVAVNSFGEDFEKLREFELPLDSVNPNSQ